jgi:Amt family ammonium transporter
MTPPIDILWIAICSALVFVMQAGFLCLESGLTRSKNSNNIAIKNLADFCLTTVVFWLFGFAFMFGDSLNGWIGVDLFTLDFAALDGLISIFFVFQVMFCGAAVTIISGIVAVRLKFASYLFMALLVSGPPLPGRRALGLGDIGRRAGKWLAGRDGLCRLTPTDRLTLLHRLQSGSARHYAYSS